MTRSWVVRGAIFLATVVAAWAVLSIGSVSETKDLVPGELAEQDYTAGQYARVVDVDETERLKQEARDAVLPPLQRDSEVEGRVVGNVRAVFDELGALAIGDETTGAVGEIPVLPQQETDTTDQAGQTSVPETSDPAVLTGTVFIDVDGDLTFDPDVDQTRTDKGMQGITVTVTTYDGDETVTTDAEGNWTYEYAGGPALVVVSTADPEIPAGYLPNTENIGQLLDCNPGDTCEADAVGFKVNPRDISEVSRTITADHPALPEDTVMYLAGVAADDVVRAALDEPLHLPKIQAVASDEATLALAAGIQVGQVNQAQVSVTDNPRIVFQDDTGADEAGSDAAAKVVAANLEANLLVNEQLWADQQEQQADQVDPVEVDYQEGEIIVRQDEVLTALEVAAIKATAVPTIEEQPSIGLIVLIGVLVGLVGLYLARFRPEFWARPRKIALLGILIVLAGGAVRGTLALSDSFGWYVLPAVVFGFVTAVLFDQRIAILMALSLGVLTAVGTLDTGATVYAILAALAPIPFVSSVSSRGAFRNAVVFSSVVAAVIAAGTSWFFHVGPNDVTVNVVTVSVVWAFGVSALSSLLGLAALQFFESAFDITTTLRLLDLTDRNHEALQMLQEEAFGTFNHSLMVGTLADAAARAIGANALLARAMAYYHDLGKTENPTYFIENQFGMANPHDDLDPRESAEIVRNHVPAGVALARRYKIPTEVTEGIVSHHGDGVMRYFYEKARQRQGHDVDIDDFRHIGHKPRTAESAILMLADSLEAACRAVFQSEEPSADSIEKVVNRVMDEKLEDGQLSESPLTLGELTKIRRAFLDSLKGHYHQRIAYPNFPGS
ncbi:MAG: HDIG domain-containing metalloprotein [Acidimicrobiia bacterium]